MIKANTSSRKRERCSGVRNRFRFSESLAARIKTQDGIAVGSAVVEIFSEINGLSESITHFVPFPGEVRVSIHFTALAINKLLQSFWGGSTRRSLDAHKWLQSSDDTGMMSPPSRFQISSRWSLFRQIFLAPPVPSQLPVTMDWVVPFRKLLHFFLWESELMQPLFYFLNRLLLLYGKFNLENISSRLEKIRIAVAGKRGVCKEKITILLSTISLNDEVAAVH